MSRLLKLLLQKVLVEVAVMEKLSEVLNTLKDEAQQVSMVT